MKKPAYLVKPVLATLVVSLLAVSASGAAYAHGNERHKKADTAISSDVHEFGQEGDPKKVVRTINVDMNDTMRFTPSEITVKQGETIKFIVHNKGKALHEMVLGTMEELKAHGELMKKNPGMEHDEPYMSHVPPGSKDVMVWKFTQPGKFNYGCLAPGHFEAGMIGKITVVAK